MSEIRQKLLAIQSRLKAPKSQYNSFSNYNYRNCEDILEALKPLLIEQNCVVTLSDNIVTMGERYYVKATAVLCDVEKGDCIEVTAFAREEETKKGMDGSQITGTSSSYARKYALNGLFCIDDTKDSDTTNKGENSNADKRKTQTADTKTTAKTGGKITAEQLANLQDVLAQNGKDVALICKANKVTALANFTIQQYESCLKMFVPK